MTVRVAASVALPTDPDTAFAAVADLPSQEKWIIATRLYAIDGHASIPQVGSRMAAFTGLGSIGFLDTMVVTEYDPPWRWVTRHEGQFVQGVGIFEIEPAVGGCRFTWAEELELPFGIIGRLGWPLAKPLARLGLQASLRRMARQLQRGALPLASAPAAVPGPGAAMPLPHSLAPPPPASAAPEPAAPEPAAGSAPVTAPEPS